MANRKDYEIILFSFNLELLFSGIKIDPSVIPSRPNCVVDTEEHNHVLAVNKSLGTNGKGINVIFLSRCIKVHDLHGPKGEDVFLVEEDPSLLRMLHPLHRVDEGDWPLIRDS